ncbi:MAG: PIN domain-containing protein [Gemmatimonadota bacterium]|jgi:predicted nucleic acid-binding protein
MTDPVFVDTNVLVYVRDATEPEKQRRAAEWMAALWEARTGRLSPQILQEYYLTLTRKLDPPRTREEARDDVTALVAWGPLPPDLQTFEIAWRVEDRFGLSWWDALVVASALRAESPWLLSEDLQDGQDLFGTRVINPFTHVPGEIP